MILINLKLGMIRNNKLVGENNNNNNNNNNKTKTTTKTTTTYSI